MGIISLTSREFNQDAARAKKAALQGPVFITDRGRPAHVLLSIEEYQRLTGQGRTLLDAISGWDGGDFEFEPAKLGDISRPADLA
jgi:prevent-host-death family protein